MTGLGPFMILLILLFLFILHRFPRHNQAS
jgi:hypothetical protein